MRLIFGEYPADYNHYQFPYQVWLVREKKDNLSQIYYSGFLPFRSKKDIFYLARSTRVRLTQFKLSSENRRILRKTEQLTFSVQPAAQFSYTPAIQKLCKRFADQTFGRGVMPTAAIRKMFTQANTTHVVTFSDQQDNKPIGYASVVVHDHFLHYAHPFYDLKYDNPNLGMGMMLKSVIWSQEQHKQFAYLGTCYTKSALYKTQFSGFEFFNGWKWSDNLDELKYLINKKSSTYLLHDQEYKQQYLEQKLEQLMTDHGVRVGFK